MKMFLQEAFGCFEDQKKTLHVVTCPASEGDQDRGTAVHEVSSSF